MGLLYISSNRVQREVEPKAALALARSPDKTAQAASALLLLAALLQGNGGGGDRPQQRGGGGGGGSGSRSSGSLVGGPVSSARQLAVEVRRVV